MTRLFVFSLILAIVFAIGFYWMTKDNITLKLKINSDTNHLDTTFVVPRDTWNGELMQIEGYSNDTFKIWGQAYSPGKINFSRREDYYGDDIRIIYDAYRATDIQLDITYYLYQ